MTMKDNLISQIHRFLEGCEYEKTDDGISFLYGVMIFLIIKISDWCLAKKFKVI